MDPNLDALRDKLRRLIGDPAGTKQVFDDDDLESFLMGARIDLERYRLEPVYDPTGDKIFTVPFGDLAEGGVIRTGGGAVVTPDVADWERGRWEFNTNQPGLYLTGSTYDLNAAAADALRAWAAKVKLEHNLGIGDLRLDRRQKAEALLQMAKEYDRKRRIASVQVPTWGVV